MIVLFWVVGTPPVYPILDVDIAVVSNFGGVLTFFWVGFLFRTIDSESVTSISVGVNSSKCAKIKNNNMKADGEG